MPKIEEKQLVVNELKEKIEKATSMVLVDARGLTVAEDTELRKALREKNVDYKVYKNTMINFAIKDTPFAELAKHLEGPTAVAISYDDATAAAGGLDPFVSKFEKLEFKAGVVTLTRSSRSQRFRQEKYCCPSSLEASSLRWLLSRV